MTWHRIDENTYIDDTLVTCAEYQLFIDEMRQQEKYYQPDHWTSHQFPQGKAHEPILGVRRSDAEAFCHWLRGRENGEWKYRLPTQNEALKSSLTVKRRAPIGYWTIEADSKLQFAWIGLFHKNSLDPDLIAKLDQAFKLATARFSMQYTSLSRDHIQELREDLAGELTQAHFLTIDRDLSQAGALALDRSLERAFNRPCVIRPTIHRLQDVDRALSRSLDRSLVLARSADRDITVDIFVNAFILKERLLGNYDALEGIRLVKERN